MDTNLTSIKLSITTAASDLQQELRRVSQSQGTQVSLEVRRQVPAAKRLLTELERDAERQIADDPNTTSATTGIQPKLFRDIKESLKGLSDADYNSVKQEKARAEKQPTLPGFREVNASAPPKPARISWAKKAKEAQEEVARLKNEKAQLEREVALLRTGNRRLRMKIQQLTLSPRPAVALNPETRPLEK